MINNIIKLMTIEIKNIFAFNNYYFLMKINK